MTVRSRPLWKPTRITAGSTWTTVYTVPTDRTPRLSLVTLANDGVAALVARIACGTSAGWDNVFLGSLAPDTSIEVLHGLVLEEDDVVKVWASVAAKLVCSGSGSLLAGDPA